MTTPASTISQELHFPAFAGENSPADDDDDGDDEHEDEDTVVVVVS